MTGKRDAHERLPELIAAAVRVFTREGYRSARMSDVAAEMGLSEAAIYRYVGSKEGLFVLAIRHALLLEDLPDGDLPLSSAPLTATLRDARDFIDEVVPFDALEKVRFRIPLRDGASIALLHQCGKVLAEDYYGNLCEIEVDAPESLRRRLSRYLIRNVARLPVENSV